MPKPPLVVHIIYRLAVGGLENGLVNLINNMPAHRYRHAIICMSDFTDFRHRLQDPNVAVYALHKRAGNDPGMHWRLWRLLRKLRPDIVHSRNLGALECQLTALLAGVRHRVHGEHGRDMTDVKGANRKYLLIRKAFKPIVSRFIALSQDLQHWLRRSAGIAPAKIVQIYNGVDTQRFHAVDGGRAPLPTSGFMPQDGLVIGTIGRMQGEKDQLTLVRAFLELIRRDAALRDQLRLVLIGDGPLKEQAAALLRDANAESLVWMPGARSDAPEIMRGLDIFALPSLVEGVSNTILEAMASGLPVVATDVGGNSELVVANETGLLVPSADPIAMADALARYVDSAQLRRSHGAAGRRRVEQNFSMKSMVNGYMSVYDALLDAGR